MILHGALAGQLDLVSADLTDSDWWRRAQLVTDWIANQQLAKLCELRLQQNFALLDYSSDQSQIDHHWEAADKLVVQLDGIYRPWIDTKAAYQDKYKRLYDGYVKMFGKPGDPEHDMRVAATVAHWKNSRTQG